MRAITVLNAKGNPRRVLFNPILELALNNGFAVSYHMTSVRKNMDDVEAVFLYDENIGIAALAEQPLARSFNASAGLRLNIGSTTSIDSHLARTALTNCSYRCRGVAPGV